MMREEPLVSFWRKAVIDFALDAETLRRVEEQRAWISAEPANPRPYYHLALLYRTQGRGDEALGLLLEAVRLDPTFAPAHVALSELYAVRDDMTAARRHAALAAQHGDPRAQQMLERHPPA
jgi:thioredoxin-like negative regulator of GroEL